MMMALGGFVFSMKTAAYQAFKRKTEQRWAKKDRVGLRAAHQYLGPNDDSVTLPGVIHPGYDFAGSAPSLETLRGLADAGVPYILVSGEGWVFGDYIILSVGDDRTFFFSDGAAMKIEFSVAIRRYEA